ncbi:NADH-quinone oxidoreductase subunit NuoE [Candidatus Aerophobetes bacterium]|uniref:NADH-quinone oxidoreductase subunit NuoE n=1 Tax=Aerophobetes bacterium TaxID=2030807 RepID=A0A662D6E4_UNCAE|nr:MAG: NADH-quinone oxidoreductase subunit NuoE [Candidatus Aerophobetes bacterium]
MEASVNFTLREIRERILRKYSPQMDSLLYILHDLQDANPQNYITSEDVKAVSKYLRIPASEVESVISFYTMFSRKPRGKYVIRFCDSPTCHLLGGLKILEEVKQILGIDTGETTRDGLFTLEMTSCLGACGVAPAMMINDEIYGNLTPSKAREIIQNYKGREK